MMLTKSTARKRRHRLVFHHHCTAFLVSRFPLVYHPPTSNLGNCLQPVIAPLPSSISLHHFSSHTSTSKCFLSALNFLHRLWRKCKCSSWRRLPGECRRKCERRSLRKGMNVVSWTPLQAWPLDEKQLDGNLAMSKVHAGTFADQPSRGICLAPLSNRPMNSKHLNIHSHLCLFASN